MRLGTVVGLTLVGASWMRLDRHLGDVWWPAHAERSGAVAVFEGGEPILVLGAFDGLCLDGAPIILCTHRRR
jgi:hypothetical protein